MSFQLALECLMSAGQEFQMDRLQQKTREILQHGLLTYQFTGTPRDARTPDNPIRIVTSISFSDCKQNNTILQTFAASSLVT